MPDNNDESLNENYLATHDPHRKWETFDAVPCPGRVMKETCFPILLSSNPMFETV